MDGGGFGFAARLDETESLAVIGRVEKAVAQTWAALKDGCDDLLRARS